MKTLICLITLLSVLQVIDIEATRIAIANGVEEANPFIRWMLDIGGFGLVYVFKLGLCFLLLILVLIGVGKAAFWTITTAVSAYLLLTIWHVVVLSHIGGFTN